MSAIFTRCGLINDHFTFTLLLILLVGRRQASGFSECKEENVTFSNNMGVLSVHISIESGGNCEVSLNVLTCADSNIEVEAHANSTGGTNVLVGVDSVEMFYGHNVTVTMNDICDECTERFYIPEMKPTG